MQELTGAVDLVRELGGLGLLGFLLYLGWKLGTKELPEWRRLLTEKMDANTAAMTDNANAQRDAAQAVKETARSVGDSVRQCHGVQERLVSALERNGGCVRREQS